MNNYFVVSAVLLKTGLSDSTKHFAWIKKVPETSDVISALSWHPVFVDNEGKKHTVKDQYAILSPTKKFAEEVAHEWNKGYANNGSLFVFDGYRDADDVMRFCSSWIV